MTKDWVHGAGHSPVCQILLQIVIKAVIISLGCIVVQMFCFISLWEHLCAPAAVNMHYFVWNFLCAIQKFVFIRSTHFIHDKYHFAVWDVREREELFYYFTIILLSYLTQKGQIYVESDGESN